MEIADDDLDAWVIYDPGLKYHQILEVGVDICRLIDNKWKWQFMDQNCNSDTQDPEGLTGYDWMKNIKIGDIINVRDYRGDWYESHVKLVNGNKIYIHFIGWVNKHDCICDIAKDYDDLAERDTICDVPFRSDRVMTRELNRLYFRWIY